MDGYNDFRNEYCSIFGMQILMGAHQTIVSIDESKMNSYNLFHFIKNQFSSYEIERNNILLNYSLENHYKHLFLIKWIYSLHKKVHNRDVLNLKDVLVNRVQKPIKIITRGDIVPVNIINLKIVNHKQIRFQLSVQNHKLLSLLNLKFKRYMQKISYSNNFIEIEVNDNDLKDEIKLFLQNSECKEMEIFFNFDKNKIYNLLAPSEQNRLLLDALMLLESDVGEDIKVIKKRYKKLLVKYHPDNVYNDGYDTIKEYTNKFQVLQNSYSIIEHNVIFS